MSQQPEDPSGPAVFASAAGPAQLSYGRPVKEYASRRKVRRLWMIALANVLVAAAILYQPRVQQYLEGRWQRHLWAVQQEKARQADLKSKRDKTEARRLEVVRQEAWLDYSIPPGTVVYEESPEEAARLLAGPEAAHYSNLKGQFDADRAVPAGYPFRLPVAWDGPADWEAVPFKDIYSRGNHVIFLHGLSSPGGNRRLVWVGLAGSQYFTPDDPRGNLHRCRINPTLEFVVAVFQPMRMFDFESAPPAIAHPSWPSLPVDRVRVWHMYVSILRGTEPANWMHVQWPSTPSADHGASHSGGLPLRLYAGQLDPHNPSHFTIDYVLHNQRGTIDGWLLDDDRLRFEPRAGALIGDSVRDYRKRAMINDMEYGWDPFGQDPFRYANPTAEGGAHGR
jgi:hypothetical protein